jgi:hypothetical protein
VIGAQKNGRISAAWVVHATRTLQWRGLSLLPARMGKRYNSVNKIECKLCELNKQWQSQCNQHIAYRSHTEKKMAA